MSESDSFIREVTEEVERDRMNRQLKKWGPWIAALILAIVGGVAAWDWQKAQDRAAAEEIGRILLSADLIDPEAATEARSVLSGPPAILAELRLAEAQFGSGDTEAAIATYLAVSENPEASIAYRDLAALRAARLQAVAGDAAEVLAAIEPLTGTDRPYRLLAMELKAGLMLNQGETDAAHALMREILDDPTRPGGLDLRLRELLQASGGSVSE
ncbi:MAG: tetratricopeptide repeat protein [Pseudomonadota bacterium]